MTRILTEETLRGIALANSISENYSMLESLCKSHPLLSYYSTKPDIGLTQSEHQTDRMIDDFAQNPESPNPIQILETYNSSLEKSINEYDK